MVQEKERITGKVGDKRRRHGIPEAKRRGSKYSIMFSVTGGLRWGLRFDYRIWRRQNLTSVSFKKHYEEMETKLKPFLNGFCLFGFYLLWVLFVCLISLINGEQKIGAKTGEKYGAQGRFILNSKDN